MDRRQKTAAISTLANLLLTLIKFILAGLSGSLVILADAWHSLTDVGTSVLVFVSVSTGNNREKSVQTAEEDKPRTRIDWRKVSLENWASLLIGLIIFMAAIGVAKKAIFSPAQEIPDPYIFGLCFILFAGISMVISLFEIKVGRQTNSPALIADGLHSRSDMISSLVAAGSLIALQLGLNQLGINFDLIGAWILVFFIVSFSVDTLFNFWWSVHGREGWTDRVALGLLAALLKPQTWNKLAWRLGKISSWNQWPDQCRSWFCRGSYLLVICGIGLLVLLNCLTVIGPAEEGIRRQWGRVVNWGDPLPPGLHFHLPAPLERIEKIDARTIRRLEIGNIADPRAIALLWTREHGAQDAFLSAENNFFHPYILIHYRIKDIFNYRYSFSQPDELLENAANRLLTRLFATRTFVEIATSYRQELEEIVRRQLQTQIDQLRSGLEITSVNTKDIHPPVEVADAYEEVVAAIQEKQTRINRALGYRNSSIPEARGWAVRSIREAEAYALERERSATGEASRFTARAESIGAWPAISRPMLYRETIKEALNLQPLILIDPAVDEPDIWLRSGRPVFLDDQY